MKPESLKALGAIPLDAETARKLGLGELGAEGLAAHLVLPGYADPVERYRKAIPGAVGKMAQVVVDNPGQIALVAAGSMVAAQMALNLMKPRTPAQALALFVVLQVALPKLAWAAVEKGWITFRIRDADGCLVPLVIEERQP